MNNLDDCVAIGSVAPLHGRVNLYSFSVYSNVYLVTHYMKHIKASHLTDLLCNLCDMSLSYFTLACICVCA